MGVIKESKRGTRRRQLVICREEVVAQNTQGNVFQMFSPYLVIHLNSSNRGNNNVYIYTRIYYYIINPLGADFPVYKRLVPSSIESIIPQYKCITLFTAGVAQCKTEERGEQFHPGQLVRHLYTHVFTPCHFFFHFIAIAPTQQNKKNQTGLLTNL